MYRTRHPINPYPGWYAQNPTCEEKQLYKEGDVVWLYAESGSPHIRLLYEAKVKKVHREVVSYVVKGGPRDPWVCSYVAIPVCDVEMPWMSSQERIQLPEHKPDYEVVRRYPSELYDPKKLTAEKMYNIAGDYNQNVLCSLSEEQKQGIRMQGLVFLGKSQIAEMRNCIARYLAKGTHRSKSVQQDKCANTTSFAVKTEEECIVSVTNSTDLLVEEDDTSDEDWTLHGPGWRRSTVASARRSKRKRPASRKSTGRLLPTNLPERARHLSLQ